MSRVPGDADAGGEVVEVRAVEWGRVDAGGVGDALLESIAASKFQPGEEIVVIARREERLPSQSQSDRQIRAGLPVVVDEDSQAGKVGAEVHALVLAGLRIEADVGFRERVVEREIEEVVEGELRASEDVGEFRPTLPGVIFRVAEAELEAVAAAVVAHHIAPLEIVLNEGRVRKARAV